MSDSEIQKIIIKFLNKEANIDELDKLDWWLKNNKNTSVFNRFVEVEFLTLICMGEYDVNKAKELINQRIKNTNRRRKINLFKRIAVAASILLVIGFSFYQYNNLLNTKSEVVKTIEVIDTGSSKAILTLDNGAQISLQKGKKYQTKKVSSDGEELLYVQANDAKNKDEKIVYNHLTIPRGGEFSVVLADGTKVWLNSDSKLKYPTNFIKGKTRDVELIYGEAYFEVSPSTKHNGSEFNVYSKGQKVNVLGTEFNIKAYHDEDQIATTLVGGKIMIQKGDVEKILKPNQQAIISDDSNEIEVFEVDASQAISWMEGIYVFNEEPLDEMMKTLARWYDAEVIFEKAEHKQFIFTGILERTDSIEGLLKLIEGTSEGEIKFEINNKTITIK